MWKLLWSKQQRYQSVLWNNEFGESFLKKILDEKEQVQKIINSSRNHNFKQFHLKDEDFDIYSA